MSSQRSVVDYALARRAVLADLAAGRAARADVCDAHPYLLRAARYHGQTTTRSCPVCRREQLTEVSYVYGDQLGGLAGSARTPDQLRNLAGEVAEFVVYVVEVCRRCEWNHLVSSYRLGTAWTTQRPGRRPAPQTAGGRPRS
jgi:hypothetical protein